MNPIEPRRFRGFCLIHDYFITRVCVLLRPEKIESRGANNIHNGRTKTREST